MKDINLIDCSLHKEHKKCRWEGCKNMNHSRGTCKKCGTKRYQGLCIHTIEWHEKKFTP